MKTFPIFDFRVCLIEVEAAMTEKQTTREKEQSAIGNQKSRMLL